MSDEAQTAAFTCPFCGQTYPDQARLTEHFDDRHDFAPADGD